MSKAKLKPCPFQPCQGKGEIRYLGFYVAIRCSECRAEGPHISTDIPDFAYKDEDPAKEAIKAWNRRAK